MSRLLKIILYTLSVVTTVCGIVLFSSGASDFFKITFGTTVDINTNDTSQYTKDTMACGTVYYTIDTIANANDTIYYYLVPTKSEKYLVVATSNQTQIDTLNTIALQTYEYLNGELQGTTTNLEVEGRLSDMDGDLQSMLYSWCKSTNYFGDETTSEISQQVLPYVLYCQDWQSIKTISILAIVVIVLGISGIVTTTIVSKKS